MTTYPYARFFMPFAQAVDATGIPRAGAKLYFYQSGTSEPLDTYADSTLSRPNENPVVADASGTWPAIFLAQQPYKAVLVDVDGDTIWAADPLAPFVPSPNPSQNTTVVECTVDGNGDVPGTGVCGDAYLPVGCTLIAAVLQANNPGDLELDIWAAPFVTNTPPTAQNSIVASTPPMLSSSVSSIDTALTGWVVDLADNTALRFSITSISDITRFTLTLVGDTSTS